MPTKSFKELIVWQKAKAVAMEIYSETAKLPKLENYGLVSQMQRAAISISSNIAEGYHRATKNDRDRFLSIAFGSGAELESQIDIAKSLYPDSKFEKAEHLLMEVQKILNKFLYP